MDTFGQFFKNRNVLKTIPCFIVYFLTVPHGMQDVNQGSDLPPVVEAPSLNHWTTKGRCYMDTIP